MARAPKTAIGMVLAMNSPLEGQNTPREKPFAVPADVQMSAGYGASESDLHRGYLEPDIRCSPEYDQRNYQDRYSEPKREHGESYPYSDDFNFRMKDRESQGFLTRPRYPSER